MAIEEPLYSSSYTLIFVFHFSDFCVFFFVLSLRTMSEPEERFSGLDPAFDGETSVYGFDFCCFFVLHKDFDRCSVRLCI